METEIEIKFLFSAQFESELYNKINTQHFISSKKQLLHNVYFDTAGRLLRKMDMGLRVRSCEGRSVQTIKTAGRVIGGLYQRPEYNEPIEGLRPALARFNSKVWPQDCDLQALEAELVPIFSTDFERQTWLLEMPGDTLIEIAYDRGVIETNQGHVDICEIELELVKGEEEQLFHLAYDIASLPSACLGNVSKAQRGYMLADNSEFAVKPLSYSPIVASMSVAQALLVNMQHGLRHIQYHENCYLESAQDDALNEVLCGLKFLHQNLRLFKQFSPTLLQAPWINDLHWLARSFSWLDERLTYQNLLADKGYYLRKLPKFKLLLNKLDEQNNKLPSQEAVLELLTSTRYCQFILKVTQWLLLFEKSSFSGEQAEPVEHFAREHLSRAWEELRCAFAINENKLLGDYQGLLESSLFVGLSFGNLFSKERCLAFRSPWLDMEQGLKEQEMINVIVELAEQETDQERQQEYYKWIRRKEGSLLHALEQSKERALIQEPYWL